MIVLVLFCLRKLLTVLGLFCLRKLFISPPVISSRRMKRGRICRLTPMQRTMFWWLNLLRTHKDSGGEYTASGQTPAVIDSGYTGSGTVPFWTVSFLKPFGRIRYLLAKNKRNMKK
jgi:hypothetical protein